MTSRYAKSPTSSSFQPGILIGLFFAVCCALFVACGGDQTKDDLDAEAAKKAAELASGDAYRARYGNLTKRGFRVVTADLNGSGQADQWTFIGADGLPKRIERDLNFNGRVDMWQYLDEDGEIKEEEMDLDFDGKIDVVTFYKDGQVTRKLMSLGFDGVFTIQKVYGSDGKLLRVERDEDGSGAPNVWEYYEGDRRVRIGWDTIGDGVPDSFDQLP